MSSQTAYQPSAERYQTMEYRRCGRSGIELSAFSLGLWHNFGFVNNFENSRNLVKTAFDNGITHFDLHVCLPVILYSPEIKTLPFQCIKHQKLPGTECRKTEKNFCRWTKHLVCFCIGCLSLVTSGHTQCTWFAVSLYSSQQIPAWKPGCNDCCHPFIFITCW